MDTWYESPGLRTGPGGLYSEGGGGKALLYEEEERICLCLHHSDPGTGSSFVAQGIPWTLLTEPPMPTPLPPDNQFRMSILERLEQMEKRMAEIAAAGQAPCQAPDAPPIQVPP